MKPVLKYAITGRNYRKIEVALEAGYVLTGKSVFPAASVILKLKPSEKDSLRITSFADATYFMDGGYPRPSMTSVDTITVRVGNDKEEVIDNLYSKMQAGWYVQSITLGKSAVLSKSRDAMTLCSDITQLEDIVYALPAAGGR